MKYDYYNLEHCKYCNRGDSCADDDHRKCIMSDDMKRSRCQTPWGVEPIYSDGLYLACKDLELLHKLAELLYSDPSVFYSTKGFSRYRLTDQALYVARKHDIKMVTGEQLVKMFMDQKIKKPV